MSFINRFADNLIPQESVNRFNTEYVKTTPLSFLMGEYKSRAVIQMKDLGQGRGRTTEFALLNASDYTSPTLNFDTLEGKEQTLEFFSDRVFLDLVRFASLEKGVILTKELTPIKVFDALRPDLLERCKRYLNKNLFDSFTTNLYPNPAANIPLYDRAIFAGLNPARDAWYGNINAGITAMNTGIGYNQNGGSVALLRQAKQIASQGGKGYEVERRIAPTQIKMKNGFPVDKYVALVSYGFYYSLVADPSWSTQVNRGVVVSDMQPEILSGGNFVGEIEGISVFTCPELGKYNMLSGGVTGAWGLFLGAGAAGLAWSLRPEFKMKEHDYDNIGIRTAEMRGQKALMYPSKVNSANLAENGIIHMFTSVTAGT